jgi:colanic acid/amylovoran biosynthesis protein
MNILIVNLHSALNLGDDAIMQATLQALKESFPEAAITAAANDPDSWRKYTDISVVGSLTWWVIDRSRGAWRWRKPHAIVYAGLLALAIGLYRSLNVKFLFGSAEQRRLLTAYYSADLVLSCGGGNFYAHRPLSIAFIWSLLTLATATTLRKRTIMLPQSLGPIEGRFQRWLARGVFDHVARILLREQQSAEFLRLLHVRQEPIVLADLAFALPAAADDVGLLTRENQRLRIGVTAMDRGAQEKRFRRQAIYEDALTSLLLRLQARYDVSFYIFCQCYGPSVDQDDRACAHRIHKRLCAGGARSTVLDNFSGAQEVRSAYKAMACVIGTRMHAGIFALSHGVPTILIGYQPKALGTMSLFDLERYCCDIERFTSDELYELACEVLDQRRALSTHIRERCLFVQGLLRQWTDYLRG